MYEALLQSADRPFRATPDTKFYFPNDSIEQARQTVVRAVLRAEGPCLVLGGAGLGKTMLVQMIAEDVYGRFDIVKLHATGLCSRRALLQSILFELQLPYRGLSEGELRMSIMDRLSPSPETAPGGILLMVDEAHTLSPKLLEELRLITNFARNGQPRARLVLIGNLKLEDTFAQPQLDSFNQRLAARCYLQPMSRDQTMEFVRHQLRCAQINPATIVTNDALRTLYAASEGVPRLVNQVMDHALVLGITTGQCPISASLIEEAWSDLQQLPAPWHSTNASQKTTTTTTNEIEFGELNDDDEHAFGDPLESIEEESVTSLEPWDSTTNKSSIDSTTEGIAKPLDKTTTTFEDNYELAAEVDTLDVITKAPSQNFFAAFAPISTETNDTELDDESLSEISPEEQLVSEIKNSTSRPAERVVFDASKAFGFNRHQAAFPRGDEPIPQPEPVAQPNAAKFFASSVTDNDILDISEAFDDRDADDVWENDPPIHGDRSKAIAAQASMSANQLFGEDFEDEISIASRGGVGKDRRIFEPKAVEALAATPLAYTTRTSRQAAAEEQLMAMESQRLEVEELRPYEDAEQAKRYTMPESSINTESLVSNWTVDVAATESDREIALHLEIEDLVSQLNFSAFAVEPFSVEQIDIDYQRGATTAAPQVLATGNDDRETIYTLHTADSAAMDDEIHSNLSLDDDRDLLIIEDELPVSNRMSTEQLGAPIVKAATYSQLFAKLRH